MRIKILAVDLKEVKDGKKDYKQLDVSYKNLDFGRVEGKKIVSFASPDVFQALKDAKAGDEFDVTKGEKSAAGFVSWTRCVPASEAGVSETSGNTGQAVPPSAGGKGTGTSTPRSTYETPEERAKKQVYIVRQSNIKDSISLLTANETNFGVKDVLAIAKQLEAYVFGNDPVQELIDMNDDIPY
jgi:hypothetical protein